MLLSKSQSTMEQQKQPHVPLLCTVAAMASSRLRHAVIQQDGMWSTL